MTEQSVAVFLNHPLAAVVVAAIVAGITAALTVKLIVRAPEAVTASGASGGMRTAMSASAAAGSDNRAVIAAIAGAVAATGAMRVVYIGEAPPVSGWATELRTRHHSSHMPQSTNH